MHVTPSGACQPPRLGQGLAVAVQAKFVLEERGVVVPPRLKFREERRAGESRPTSQGGWTLLFREGGAASVGGLESVEAVSKLGAFLFEAGCTSLFVETEDMNLPRLQGSVLLQQFHRDLECDKLWMSKCQSDSNRGQ